MQRKLLKNNSTFCFYEMERKGQSEQQEHTLKQNQEKDSKQWLFKRCPWTLIDRELLLFQRIDSRSSNPYQTSKPGVSKPWNAPIDVKNSGKKPKIQTGSKELLKKTKPTGFNACFLCASNVQHWVMEGNLQWKHIVTMFNLHWGLDQRFVCMETNVWK